MPFSLIVADHREFRLGGRFSKEVVHACLSCDGCSRERIVTGDHDGLDPDATHIGKTLTDPTLYDVSQLHHTQHTRSVGDHQRRSALLGALLDHHAHHGGEASTLSFDELNDRICCTLADLSTF